MSGYQCSIDASHALLQLIHYVLTYLLIYVLTCLCWYGTVIGLLDIGVDVVLDCYRACAPLLLSWSGLENGFNKYLLCSCIRLLLTWCQKYIKSSAVRILEWANCCYQETDYRVGRTGFVRCRNMASLKRPELKLGGNMSENFQNFELRFHDYCILQV